MTRRVSTIWSWRLRSVSQTLRLNQLLRIWKACPHVPDAVSGEMRVNLQSVAVSGVPGDGSRVHTHDHDGSEAPDESPDSILSSEPKPLGKNSLSFTFLLSPESHPLSPIITCIHESLNVDAILSVWILGWNPDDGRLKVSECACGAVHLARHSPTEGGDSEIGGDGDGVVMVKSLSTSASGGRDMEV
ncbi:hypothetical protein Tco_0645486 [Tanacetum coccineum]